MAAYHHPLLDRKYVRDGKLYISEAGSHWTIYLLEPLGQGRTARVYRSINMGIVGRQDYTQKFAAKIVPLAPNRNLLTFIQRECTLHRLFKDSEHIVRLEGDLIFDQDWSIAFYERMTGGTLEDFLATHRRNKLTGLTVEQIRALDPYELLLPEAAIGGLFWQLASGLAFIHQKGYAHTDLKMANLLLDRQTYDKESPPKIKITKLGGAIIAGPYRHYTVHRTGTIPYVAPEVCFPCLSSDGYNAQKADIWSLGVILWSMFHGGGFPYELPNEVDNMPIGFQYAALFEQINHKEPTFNGERINASAISLMEGMLMLDPVNRPVAEDLASSNWVYGVPGVHLGKPLRGPRGNGLTFEENEELKRRALSPVRLADLPPTEESPGIGPGPTAGWYTGQKHWWTPPPGEKSPEQPPPGN